MAALTKPPGLPLPLWSDYPRFLRRHRAGIGALMGLGLLAGLAFSLLQPATYSATASVAITQVPVYLSASPTELIPPEVSIDTDAQLLGSPRVLGAIGDALGTDPDLASDHLAVTASPNSHVLHVTLTAASPQRAAQAANAAVGAFIEVRRDALGALEESQLRQLRLVISEQERVLAREQNKRLVITSDDEVFAQVLDLRARLDELEQARSVPAEVVSPAVAPSGADYANTEVPLASGAMLGLLAGCLLGAARDRASRLGHRADNPRTHSDPSGYLPDVATRHEGYRHAL
jgi:uncharacterized protein involved in exopolysaccharide biosynthesis